MVGAAPSEHLAWCAMAPERVGPVAEVSGDRIKAGPISGDSGAWCGYSRVSLFVFSMVGGSRGECGCAGIWLGGSARLCRAISAPSRVINDVASTIWHRPVTSKKEINENYCKTE